MKANNIFIICQSFLIIVILTSAQITYKIENGDLDSKQLTYKIDTGDLNSGQLTNKIDTKYMVPLCYGSCTLLYDEGHDDYHPASDHVAVIDSIYAEGVTATMSTGILSDSLLQGFDVLYINEPRVSFTSTEQSAVYNFVINGGGLFIAHDFNTGISNTLLAPFGLSINSYSGPPGAIPGVDLPITNLEPHPITSGLNLFYWNSGNSLNIISSDWTILAKYNNAPLLAVREAGAGRIAVIGDNDLFADSFDVPTENVELFTNIVLWLCGGPCEPPIANAGDDQIIDEGEVVQLNGSASSDPDGNITTFEWDFNSKDGLWWDTGGTPDAVGPTPTHIYGDNGVFNVTLRVMDDQNLTDTDSCNITVLNIAPIIDPIQEYTINEFKSVTLIGHATDPGSDDLTFTWNWGYTPWSDKTTTYYNDGTSPDPYPSPTVNSRDITENATCQYGDNGVFTVTLTVSDDDGGLMIISTNITVNNVAPTVTIEPATMNVEISLRVAGSKWSNVGLTLYENDTEIGYLEVERWPGSPDDNPTYENPALPTTLNMTKSYKAVVTYDPYPDNGDEIKGDQPNNGKDKQNNAGNPVWIIMKFSDGSEEKIHHTFNTQQSKKKDSEHWNHVEPWEVDLNGHLVGHEFEISSHITDPGSDDETLTFTYGSQVVIVTHLNNPPNPDPYSSPEVNSTDFMDSTKLTYEGPGTVSLFVEDDDGGTIIETLELS